MFISVVVPTYRRSEKLINCLKSLKSQHYDNKSYEVIVVEDDENKKAKKVVEELGFQYLFQPHRGPAAARNLGVSKAKGEVVAFTDDDCVVPKGWLAEISRGYEKYPEVAGVGGFMEADERILASNLFARYESYMTRVVYGAGEKEVIGYFEVPTGGTNNLSYRKEVFQRLNGFDEHFPVAAGEDADFKKRVCDSGYKLLFIPLKVTHWHKYSLKSFLRQNRDRGYGSLYFHKKHGGGLSRPLLLFGIILSPLSFIKSYILRETDFGTGFLKMFSLIINYFTQLKYYGKV